MKNERISRDTYFMRIAHDVALRSTCLRGQVGAVMVSDGRILSTGYNGAPRGFPHCTPETCNPLIDHCRATVHAEMNAIINAAIHGVALKGAVLFCTHWTCPACARALINLGIIGLIVPISGDATLVGRDGELVGINLLIDAGIAVLGLNPETQEVREIEEITRNATVY